MRTVRSRVPEEQRRARKIKLLLLDVDGVLTNGEIIYDRRGREIKAFDIYDGTGIWLAQAMGMRVGVLSGRVSEVVKVRARELEITLVYQGSRDKLNDGLDIARNLRIRPDQVAFMGDEIVDMPLLRVVGFAAAPPNARPEVKEIVHYVTICKGGEGAVREVIEFLLKAQKKWETVIAPFTTPHLHES